jgi:hypothetical protein
VFCLPNIGQDSITLEDIRFREYLECHRWDVEQLGLLKGESVDGHATGEVAIAEVKASVTGRRPVEHIVCTVMLNGH